MVPNVICALSGGGFRATLFHAGVLRALIRLGLKQHISTISSVSGGSITSALFTLHCHRIDRLAAYDDLVLKPLISFCNKKFSSRCLIRKLLHIPRTVSAALLNWLGLKSVFSLAQYSCNSLFIQELDDVLFHDAKVSELCGDIRLCINATNLNTGVRWRFTKEDFGDYKTGYAYDTCRIKLSEAVAASAGYPLLFAPLSLQSDRYIFFLRNAQKEDVSINTDLPLFIHLSDGGIYDNLGMQAIQHHLGVHPEEFVIISDASSGFSTTHKPFGYFSSLWRIVDILLEQIVSRDRQTIIHKLKNQLLQGVYFHIEKSTNHYRSIPQPNVSPDILPAFGLADGLVKQVRQISTKQTTFTPNQIDLLLYHAETLTELQIAKWHNALYQQLISSPGYVPPAPDYDLG